MSMWQRILRERQRMQAGTLWERYGRLWGADAWADVDMELGQCLVRLAWFGGVFM
jgi:hypothetical protein